MPPYSVSHVRCEASCETTGTLRSFLQFNTGDDESPQLVDVSATVVGQALELLEHDHTDEHVQQISFGHLYFGECVDVCKTLLNNSPHGCTFRIDIVDNVGAGEVGVEVVSERSSGPLSVSPREGVLEPYSQLPLSIKFRPRLAKVERGFKSQQKRGQTHQYNLQVIISATDTGQSLKADITAVALDPDVALNHKELNFGSCGVFERLDTVLKIENKVATLSCCLNDVLPRFHSVGTFGPALLAEAPRPIQCAARQGRHRPAADCTGARLVCSQAIRNVSRRASACAGRYQGSSHHLNPSPRRRLQDGPKRTDF